MPTTTNYGWTTPADTDLVKDGASAIRTLGNGVDTTLKSLNPETTLGDLSYRSSTSNTNTRLAIGSTGQVLTVSGGVPTWASPAGGGKVLQVVQGYKSDTFSTTSTSFTDVTGLSVSITPSASTSKILIIGQVSIGNIAKDGSTPAATQVRLRRDTTTIFNGDAASTRNQGFSIVEHSDQIVNSPSSFIYLDSPATTSSTTYKIQILTNNASATTYVNRSFNDADSSLVLRTASSIIALEIGA